MKDIKVTAKDLTGREATAKMLQLLLKVNNILNLLDDHLGPIKDYKGKDKTYAPY